VVDVEESVVLVGARKAAHWHGRRLISGTFPLVVPLSLSLSLPSLSEHRPQLLSSNKFRSGSFTNLHASNILILCSLLEGEGRKEGRSSHSMKKNKIFIRVENKKYNTNK